MAPIVIEMLFYHMDSWNMGVIQITVLFFWRFIYVFGRKMEEAVDPGLNLVWTSGKQN